VYNHLEVAGVAFQSLTSCQLLSGRLRAPGASLRRIFHGKAYALCYSGALRFDSRMAGTFLHLLSVKKIPVLLNFFWRWRESPSSR